MIVLLADSGSTKTAWRIIDNGKIKNVRTDGINPYYVSQEGIEEILRKDLLPHIKNVSEVKEIYFYGAGLGTAQRKKEVSIPMHFVFREAAIEVEHDLMAAARALLGNKPGIACIAGTGSNSGYYDGKDISENIASLGLYLGDEGSGGYLGKLLITDYLRDRLPIKLKEKFETYTKDRLSDVLEKIYKQPYPNRYLASHMPFILENQKDEYIKSLIFKNFDDFFENNIELYKKPGATISFVGSVAELCSSYLKKVAKERGYKIGKIISDPIDALTEFHIKK